MNQYRPEVYGKEIDVLDYVRAVMGRVCGYTCGVHWVKQTCRDERATWPKKWSKRP